MNWYVTISLRYTTVQNAEVCHTIFISEWYIFREQSPMWAEPGTTDALRHSDWCHCHSIEGRDSTEIPNSPWHISWQAGASEGCFFDFNGMRLLTFSFSSMWWFLSIQMIVSWAISSPGWHRRVFEKVEFWGRRCGANSRTTFPKTSSHCGSGETCTVWSEWWVPPTRCSFVWTEIMILWNFSPHLRILVSIVLIAPIILLS